MQVNWHHFAAYNKVTSARGGFVMLVCVLFHKWFQMTTQDVGKLGRIHCASDLFQCQCSSTTEHSPKHDPFDESLVVATMLLINWLWNSALNILKKSPDREDKIYDTFFLQVYHLSLCQSLCCEFELQLSRRFSRTVTTYSVFSPSFLYC